MPVIAATKPGPKDGQGFVRFADGVEAWTPELDKVLPLIGKELPSDWTLKDGPRGKQLLPPRPKGGATAYRNSKEGQVYEQERMDRRTALMQAVELMPLLAGGNFVAERVPELITRWLADEFYRWLRQPLQTKVSETPDARQDVSATAGSGDAMGKGAPGPATTPESCEHPKASMSLEKPSGGALMDGFGRCTICGKVMPTGEFS